MMNLLLFIVVLVVSFIIVRIGAIAFQLTGLEWSVAKFQALSCFTATGFTTREAELITSSSQRRKIASVLIILGHAGFVTMIATFANTLRPKASHIPFVPFELSENALTWLNLAIIIAVIFIVYKVFTNTKFARRLTTALRKRVAGSDLIKSVSFEELTIATGGYGVSKIEIAENFKITNKKLYESGLRSHDIMVLAIIRNGQTSANPSADTVILPGDELICFGKLDNIKKRVYSVFGQD